MSDLFEKNNRRRNQEGKFKKDLWWTPWNDAWSYKMSEVLKDMLERTARTFIEAFIGALTVAPLVGVEAETIQLAALAGGGAALAVVKTYAKKQISKQVSSKAKVLFLSSLALARLKRSFSFFNII